MITVNKRAAGRGFWKDHSDAWKLSGLTQVAYCTQHDISYQSFIYQRHHMASKAKRTTVNFVEAKLEKPPVNHKTTGLQLMLPNGVRVGIANEIDGEFLKTVLVISGSLSC